MRGIAFDADGHPVDAAPVRLAPSVDELHRRVRAEIPYWEDDEVLHPCLECRTLGPDRADPRQRLGLVIAAFVAHCGAALGGSSADSAACSSALLG